MLWWIKESDIPPLVTTSPPNTPITSAGVLGQPGTVVVFGGADLEWDSFAGVRVSGGWLFRSRAWGIMGSVFRLEDRSLSFLAASDPPGSPILGRAIVDAQTGQEIPQLVAFPNTFAGSIGLTTSTRLWGTDLNVVFPCECNHCDRLILFMGFRYADLDENLTVNQTTNLLAQGNASFLGTPISAPDGLQIIDQFDTRNQFYGIQVGGWERITCGSFFLDTGIKLGLGSTRQLIDIQGYTALLTPAGVAEQTTGGLLGLSTNIGRHDQTRFTFASQLDIAAGWQLTRHFHVYAGYTLFYWSSVLRPGEQVDRVVNTTQVPSSSSFGPLTGPSRPAVLFRRSEFWAQGFVFGGGFRY